MLPLDTVTIVNTLNHVKALNAGLRALKSIGVDGVMVDVWVSTLCPLLVFNHATDLVGICWKQIHGTAPFGLLRGLSTVPAALFQWCAMWMF